MVGHDWGTEARARRVSARGSEVRPRDDVRGREPLLSLQSTAGNRAIARRLSVQAIPPNATSTAEPASAVTGGERFDVQIHGFSRLNLNLRGASQSAALSALSSFARRLRVQVEAN